MSQGPRNYRDFLRLKAQEQERRESVCNRCLTLKSVCKCRAGAEKKQAPAEKE